MRTRYEYVHDGRNDPLGCVVLYEVAKRLKPKLVIMSRVWFDDNDAVDYVVKGKEGRVAENKPTPFGLEECDAMFLKEMKSTPPRGVMVVRRMSDDHIVEGVVLETG